MAARSDMEPHFISIKSAAARLGLSTDEVYELATSGELAHLPIEVGSKIHILAADVDRWALEASKAGAR